MVHPMFGSFWQKPPLKLSYLKPTPCNYVNYAKMRKCCQLRFQRNLKRNWFNVSAVLENDPQRLTRKSRFWRFRAIPNHYNHGRKLQSQAVTLKLPWLRWFIFRWSWWNDVLDAIEKKWSWTVLKGHITTRSQKTGRSGGFLSNNFQLWVGNG